LGSVPGCIWNPCLSMRAGMPERGM